MSSKEPDNNERSDVAQKPVEAPSHSGQDCCTGSESLITVDKESSRTTALSAAAVAWKQSLNYLRRREGDSVDEVELLLRGMKELLMELLRDTVWWIQEAEQSAILEAAQKQLPDDWPQNYAFAHLLSIADLGSTVHISQPACSCSGTYRMVTIVSCQNVAFERYGADLYVPEYSLWQETHYV